MFKARIASLPDFLTGGFFAVIGLAVAVLSSRLSLGTSARMGAGFFPLLLGAALALLGLIIMAKALRRPHHHFGPREQAAFEPTKVLIILGACIAFFVMMAVLGVHGLTGLDVPVAIVIAPIFFVSRPLFWLLAGIAAFGLLIGPAGLILASLTLIVFSALASHDFDWKETLMSWALLLALCLAIFVWGLGLRIPVLPSFLPL